MPGLSTVVLASLCIWLATFWIFKRRRRAGEPPLVKYTIPFVGAALEFGQDPVAFLKSLQKKHGDVFTVKMAGWNVNFLMNPLDVRTMEKCRQFDKTKIIGDFVTRMVGQPHRIHNQSVASPLDRLRALATGKSSEEARRGGTLIPKLLERNLRGSMGLADMCHSATQLVPRALRNNLDADSWVKGRPVKSKLLELCSRIIFDVTYNLLFGSLPDQEECRKDTKRMLDEFFIYNERSALLVDRIPIHLLPATKASRSRLFRMLSEIDWSERTNVSSLISDIVGVDVQLQHMDRRVRHLLVILWAAQANTTPALFWVLYYILRNPDAKVAIMEEFDAFCSKKNGNSIVNNNNNNDVRKKKIESGGFPDMTLIETMEKKDIDHLVVLDSCLKEVFRLVGSSINAQIVTEDTTLKCASGKQHRLRKGDYAYFYAPLIHLDPAIFPNPHEFIYDRFLSNDDDPVTTGVSCSSDSEESTPSSARKPKSRFYKEGQRISASNVVLTFGFGKSRCPGRHIAIIEIKLLTLALLKYFDVALLEDGEDTMPDFDLTHIGFGVMPPIDDREVSIKVKSP